MNHLSGRAPLTHWLGLVFLLALGGCAPLVVTGVGAGLQLVDDRRSAGVYLLDEEIELKAAGRLSDARIEGAHANFTSFNRRLLVTGEAPTEDIKAKIGALLRDLPNVREIINELSIGAPSGYVSRSNDSYITAKAKTRLIDDSRFNAHHIKVVTEGEAIYLMGLVRRDEGDAAAEVVARTTGASRVIKVFEYLD
jgi:osmotically-inducible protein OsmY